MPNIYNTGNKRHSRTLDPRLGKVRSQDFCLGLLHMHRHMLTQISLSVFFSCISITDVIEAGLKILQIPGQKDTNFNVLYEVGY